MANVAAGLIAPHGGIDAPVNCTVPEGEVGAFLDAAQELVRVPVSDADLSSVSGRDDSGAATAEASALWAICENADGGARTAF